MNQMELNAYIEGITTRLEKLEERVRDMDTKLKDMEVWEDMRTDFETHTLSGKKIIVKNVRAQKHKKRGTVRIFIDDIIKAEEIDKDNKKKERD